MRAIRLASLGFVVPFVLSMVVYFGFTSSYTSGVFSEAGFRQQYETGIYRYRVLGRISLLAVHDALDAQGPARAPRVLTLMDRDASPRLYTAYFLHNTFFLCLTCCALFFLFAAAVPERAAWIADLTVVLLCLMMAITQYVVVPYDTMSYFFMAVGFVLTYRRQRPATLIALCAVVVLGTLTRETSALIVAFYAAVHHEPLLKRPFRMSAHHVALALLVIGFVSTYAGMRLVFGADQAFFKDFQLAYNLGNPFGLAGLFFFVAVLAILMAGGPGRREGALFLLASVPYVLFVLATAILWEIRLWVPIFLSIVVLKVCEMRESTPTTALVESEVALVASRPRSRLDA